MIRKSLGSLPEVAQQLSQNEKTVSQFQLIKAPMWAESELARVAIEKWTETHLGQRLEVTCVKDQHMHEFWDDKAVQVVPNTGLSLSEEKLAQDTAASGKAQGPSA